MTAYLMTAEQHAQIVDALEWPTPGVAAQTQRNLALAMLKAMKPVEAVAWTLTEELTKQETTTRAHLWFSNPVNCLWTPLYALGDTE